MARGEMSKTREMSKVKSERAPICLFVYSRLEEMKNTIKALQANYLASESDLYIFSDGPQNENLNEKLQNLEYKFQKLEEFTEQKNIDEFCKKFKKNAQKNFDLFLTISMISKQAKQLEKEIKDIEVLN